jgi:hypothetical protein
MNRGNGRAIQRRTARAIESHLQTVGWISRQKTSRLPAEGEAFLLTSPFIEPPISECDKNGATALRSPRAHQDFKASTAGCTTPAHAADPDSTSSEIPKFRTWHSRKKQIHFQRKISSLRSKALSTTRSLARPVFVIGPVPPLCYCPDFVTTTCIRGLTAFAMQLFADRGFLVNRGECW